MHSGNSLFQFGDYQKVKNLGKGSFARVNLVRSVSDNQMMAMKEVEKTFLVFLFKIAIIKNIILGSFRKRNFKKLQSSIYS